MRKLLKVTLLMVAVALFTFTGMSAADEVSSEKETKENATMEMASKKEVNENVCVEVEEEGVMCKVYKDGALVAKCFICNCKKLAEGAL